MIRSGLIFGLICIIFSATGVASDITISHREASLIGEKIFHNECAGKEACLTSWNRGEAFPSLGIGHFIWYPVGTTGPFQESFPELIRFMQERGIQMPVWLKQAVKTGAPWPSRRQFQADQNSQKMQQLRKFLSTTKDAQAAFMVQRLNRALPKILTATPVSEHEHIKKTFYQIADTPMGYYALIDYVNFKGEGVKLSERYQGRGWGLLQVLQEMDKQHTHKNTLVRFSESAKEVLTRRVKLSPPERNERRWLVGWKKRVSTYAFQ